MAQIKVGNYTLLETLGVGSFGKVKLAVHSQTGHKVAMKIVNRRRITNMDMVGRVKREIQYLKALRHPHIIKLYEVITTPTDIILVMEYAGGELFNYIVERGRMTEDDARRFFQQIICAVEFCHKQNVVHRDLKPENVLLDDNNQVKIGDFGLSNVMNDGDFLKTSCGSPNYAAPEVISGKLYEGPEVDVWSCGVILYVMLCGRLPFDDDYIPNLFKKINGGIFTLPSFLSSATKSLLSAMLVVDPLKRITIPEIRQREWFNVCLPSYLNPLNNLNIPDPFLQLDETIVAEIIKKTGWHRDVVEKSLRDKSDKENNQVKVAYQLILDYRRSKLGALEKQGLLVKTLQPFRLGTSPPIWSSGSPSKGGLQSSSAQDSPSSSIQVLNSAILNKDGTAGGTGSTTATSATTSSGKSKSKSRSKWHFGIRSRSPPFDIMLEIYRALKNCGMTWKPIDAFHIRARHIAPNGEAVKVDIQLYKVESNNYLVDFKNATPALRVPATHGYDTLAGSTSASSETSDNKTDPDSPTTKKDKLQAELDAKELEGKEVLIGLSSFAFFDACSRLITELAIQG
ncbi:protein kinase, AMP-activated, alpha 2 catalytic subunit [Chytridiales sp. JEL 0842]|nr:protein kinase, AMP-activated, alpha 2 catalytic subunit [Chytridiales sp. JEL 0842]